jgi:D-alanine-D-alanine ligase
VKVAILFDGASAFARSPDLLILASVDAIEQSLVSEGNEVVRIGVHADGKWIDRLRRARVDLVFNMCEGIDGIATLESSVISVLELFDLPFTGASSVTAAICLRKHLVNALLEKAGLPVPRFGVVRRGGTLPSVGFPAICKPAAEDASLGVEQRSVVRNTRQLAARVEAMLEQWDEIVVQRYIDGREVNVGVLDGTVLPIAEIDFTRLPAGMWPIVTYRSKWETGSDEDLGSVPRCPARLPVRVAAQVRRVAVAAWRVTGGSGYGRVDMRVDREGRPWILEVNANPDIAPDAGLARMARVAGIEYPALIRLICQEALDRAKRKHSTAERWDLMQSLSGLDPRVPAMPGFDLFGGIRQ